MDNQPIKTIKTDSTIKVKAVSKEDEIQYLQKKLNEASVAMVSHYCPETVQAFEAANKAYFEAENAYRIAWRLLRERARTVANALFTLADF